jgi:hypothetical protein
MTAKKKAKDLILTTFISFEKLALFEAKKISFIVVNELMINNPNNYKYWEQVKQEIEKL